MVLTRRGTDSRIPRLGYFEAERGEWVSWLVVGGWWGKDWAGKWSGGGRGAGRWSSRHLGELQGAAGA